MRNTFRYPLRSAALAAALAAALCAPAAAQAEIKIGAVNVADIAEKSPLLKSAQQTMRGEFEKRQKEIEDQGKKLAGDIEKFQKERDLISSDERAKREKDLATRQIDLQAAQKKFNEDVSSRDREISRDITTRLRDVINQVAKERGLDLVVRDPVFAGPNVDITAEVLKRLQAAPAPAKK